MTGDEIIKELIKRRSSKEVIIKVDGKHYPIKAICNAIMINGKVGLSFIVGDEIYDSDYKVFVYDEKFK